MNKINIAVLGLGVVGSEVVNIVNSNCDKIKSCHNLELNIKMVFVRDIKKDRNCNLSGIIVTNEIERIIEDKEIQIVVECMGGAGTEETYDYILRLFNMKKNVVMSSKKVLALYGMQIIDAANTNKCFLKYDATVGGGIPIAKVIANSFKGDNIDKFIGILNATSNFICTKMEKEKLDYLDALKIAQSLGYAENDPTEDVGGFDAMYKSIVLLAFTMGIWVDYKEIETYSLDGLRKKDISYANELGYSIKPLAVFEKINDKTVYRIGPCLVEKNHIVANTNLNNNVIVVKGEHSGEFAFYGQGAGSNPTATAMYDDMYNVMLSLLYGGYNFARDKIVKPEKADIIEMYRSHLYVRIVVDNQIGMLAKITKILADNELNVDKIIQKDSDGDKMGIVFLTSSVDNEVVQKIQTQFYECGVEIKAVIPFLGG